MQQTRTKPLALTLSNVTLDYWGPRTDSSPADYLAVTYGDPPVSVSFDTDPDL